MAGLALTVLAASVSGVDSAQACSRVFSTRSANGQALVVGRTMALVFKDRPSLALRPCGRPRPGHVGNPDAERTEWTSRYGSVGIISAGKTVADGMNEAVLSANLLDLTGTEHGPIDPGKPKPVNAQMVSFVPDNVATVAEAVAALEKVQVVSGRIRNQEWPLRNLKRNSPSGGQLAVPGDPDPASRFVRASTDLRPLPQAESSRTGV